MRQRSQVPPAACGSPVLGRRGAHLLVLTCALNLASAGLDAIGFERFAHGIPRWIGPAGVGVGAPWGAGGRADVVVLDRVGAFQLLGGRPVESVIQDRFDAAVAVAADGERACGGRFQAFVAVALGQSQEPEAGAVGLLRMSPAIEDGGDQGAGRRPDLLGPADEAVGRPIAHLAMLLGHVLGRGDVTPLAGRADMAGDALAAVEALDGVGGQSDVELAPDQRVGNRVVVPVDLHVVVDVKCGAPHFAEHFSVDGAAATGRQWQGVSPRR